MSLDVYLICKRNGTVYEDNITHNLNGMAYKAGLYFPVWRPEEIKVDRAFQLRSCLTNGLHILKANPQDFEPLNPANGVGSYDTLVSFVEWYLEACKKYPNAYVKVSR